MCAAPSLPCVRACKVHAPSRAKQQRSFVHPSPLLSLVRMRARGPLAMRRSARPAWLSGAVECRQWSCAERRLRQCGAAPAGGGPARTSGWVGGQRPPASLLTQRCAARQPPCTAQRAPGRSLGPSLRDAAEPTLAPHACGARSLDCRAQQRVPCARAVMRCAACVESKGATVAGIVPFAVHGHVIEMDWLQAVEFFRCLESPGCRLHVWT